MRFQETEIFINCRFRKETKSTIRSKLENLIQRENFLHRFQPIVFQILVGIDVQEKFQSKTKAQANGKKAIRQKQKEVWFQLRA